MWFTEDPWPPMLICGVAALIGLGFWSSSKRVLPLGFSAFFLIAAGVIYLVERTIVTPAEHVQDLLVQLVDEFKQRDPKTLDHFSASAPGWRAICERAMNDFTVEDDLALSDFHTKMTNEETRAVVSFRAKGTVSAPSYTIVKTYFAARFEVTWEKEGGDWKVVDVKRFSPVKDSEELPIDAVRGS